MFQIQLEQAVANWAKTLSFELAEYGITVNNVLPGFTDTNRLKTLIDKKSKTLNKSVEEITKKMISSVPANRFGEVLRSRMLLLFYVVHQLATLMVLICQLTVKELLACNGKNFKLYKRRTN